MRQASFIRASPEVIERAAGLVLLRNRITEPPVDVDAVAENEGLRFEYMELTAVSGAYMREGVGRGCAFIAVHEPRLRQRFSKAHELAHHLFDDPVIAHAAGYPALRLPTGYRGGSERHWAHEFFAACLLMPRAWVGDVVRYAYDERPQLITRVAQAFEVSERAAEIRLRELGHIP